MRRRTFLKGFAATATAASAGPLIVTERTIAQTRTIYVNTWGGSWTAAEEAAFFKPFTEQTGIRVRTVAPVSYAKLKAQVQSGNYEWDITAITQADLLRAEREGLVEPVDWTVVKKEKLLPERRVRQRPRLLRARHEPRLPQGQVPAGRTEDVGRLLGRQEVPGNRAMLNNAVRTRAVRARRGRRAGRQGVPAGRRPRLPEARPDQAAHQGLVDARQPVAAAAPRR